MLAFILKTGVGYGVESLQQVAVAVAERLRKREPSQLAPGMAFLFEGSSLLFILRIRESNIRHVLRIDHRVMFAGFVFGL